LERKRDVDLLLARPKHYRAGNDGNAERGEQTYHNANRDSTERGCRTRTGRVEMRMRVRHCRSGARCSVSRADADALFGFGAPPVRRVTFSHWTAISY
jgi:hypothetical protein